MRGLVSGTIAGVVIRPVVMGGVVMLSMVMTRMILRLWFDGLCSNGLGIMATLAIRAATSALGSAWI